MAKCMAGHLFDGRSKCLECIRLQLAAADAHRAEEDAAFEASLERVPREMVIEVTHGRRQVFTIPQRSRR